MCLQSCSLESHVRISRRGHGICGHRVGKQWAVGSWLLVFVMVTTSHRECGCRSQTTVCSLPWNMRHSKIAAWGIYNWDSLISSLMLEVLIVLQLYKKQVIDQVGSVPWIAVSPPGEEFPDGEGLTGERCYGEAGLLWQPCAQFECHWAYSPMIRNQKLPNVAVDRQRAWQMGPDCHVQWWCELLPAWCLATS